MRHPYQQCKVSQNAYRDSVYSFFSERKMISTRLIPFFHMFVNPPGIELMGRMYLLHSDAASVMAAVAVASGSPRISALKESPFLPSVSGESGKIF